MSAYNFKIIFLSDMHLVYGKKFLGIDTFNSFATVIDHILKFHSDLDCLLIGGDLIQDQKKESFNFFESQINRIVSPKLYARGNHDLSDSFFSKLDAHNGKFSYDNWEIIRVDTYSTGNIYGQVNIDNLNKIAKELNKVKDKHFILYMHHNLFLTSSPWLDIHITKNKDEVLSLISKMKNIKLVINGHIHQETKVEYKGITFVSSPSTSIQFTSNEENFKLDNSFPGYLVISLNRKGDKKIHCQRVEGSFGVPEKNPETY